MASVGVSGVNWHIRRSWPTRRLGLRRRRDGPSGGVRARGIRRMLGPDAQLLRVKSDADGLAIKTWAVTSTRHKAARDQQEPADGPLPGPRHPRPRRNGQPAARPFPRCGDRRDTGRADDRRGRSLAGNPHVHDESRGARPVLGSGPGLQRRPRRSVAQYGAHADGGTGRISVTPVSHPLTFVVCSRNAASSC